MSAHSKPTRPQVRIHPHRSKVVGGEEQCVSVTPAVKHGRAYYRGFVKLRNARFIIHQSGVKRARQEQVRNVHAWCVGELVTESAQAVAGSEELSTWTPATYHYNEGRFLTAEGKDVTDCELAEAMCVGRHFYVRVR